MLLFGARRMCMASPDGGGSDGSGSRGGTAAPHWLPFPPQEWDGLRDPVELATAEGLLAAMERSRSFGVGINADLRRVPTPGHPCPHHEGVVGGELWAGDCPDDPYPMLLERADGTWTPTTLSTVAPPSLVSTEAAWTPLVGAESSILYATEGGGVWVGTVAW